MIKRFSIFAICVFSIIVILFFLRFIIPIGSASIRAKIILSYKQPLNNKWGIELVAISNQFATIKIFKTGEVVSAKIGNRFECQHYKRLFLKNVSIEKGEVELGIYFSELYPAIKGITY